MTDDSSRAIDREIAKIDDEVLRKRISSLVNDLRETRDFGLVFEEHLPEEVRFPTHPVERENLVGLRDKSTGGKWRVLGFKNRKRTAVLVDQDGNESERPTAELVVIREFGEVVYPGFELVDSLQEGDPGERHHVVINGENFHALQALDATHHEAVDVIYIDPPYNTGNDSWIYNDKYVDKKDLSSSSKWLSFMQRRLDLAYGLLKETGVIMVAIGDQEHHRLRMLLDQIFGRKNFISSVVWQGGRKNDSRFVSNGADYMLIYAKSAEVWAVSGVKVKDAPDVHTLTSSEIPVRGARWRDTKPGVEDVLAQGAKAWAESGGDPDQATKMMRAWFKAQPKDSPAKAMSRSVYFLPDGRLCRDTDITWPGGGGPDYDVPHPETGQPVPVPEAGWRYSTPERMQEAIDGGWVIFREDHTKPISLKKPLDSVTGQVALSVFDRQRTHATRHLYEPKGRTGVFHEDRFPNPKDHEVLMRWIRMAAPKDAIVLDFFGGSGSTTEAVMRLNAEDGGIRQSILVTNNEVSKGDAASLRKAGHHPGDKAWEAKGVFEYVTRPRITTIVTGKREDGSIHSGGLPANVSFYNLRYLDRDRVDYGMEFEPISPLLWMQAGAVGPVIQQVDERGFAIAPGYAVIFQVDKADSFVKELTSQERSPSTVFIVTDSEQSYRSVSARFPKRGGPRLVRLYEDYLSNFEINTDNRS